MSSEDFDTFSIGGTGYQYSAPKLETLDGTDYTLATIVADATGSVYSFSDKVVDMMKSAAENIQIPTQANPKDVPVLLRASEFSLRRGGVQNVRELHGFRKLSDVDTVDYEKFNASGMTNAYDAFISEIKTTEDFVDGLDEYDFVSNAVLYLITDGIDTDSVATLDDLAAVMRKARNNEKVESILFFLIGVNAKDYGAELQNMADVCEFDKYYTVEKVERDGLGGLGNFIASMTLSQSQSLGTGQPSQNIPAKI